MENLLYCFLGWFIKVVDEYVSWQVNFIKFVYRYYQESYPLMDNFLHVFKFKIKFPYLILKLHHLREIIFIYENKIYSLPNFPAFLLNILIFHSTEHQFSKNFT